MGLMAIGAEENAIDTMSTCDIPSQFSFAIGADIVFDHFLANFFKWLSHSFFSLPFIITHFEVSLPEHGSLRFGDAQSGQSPGQADFATDVLIELVS
jgi:hypothetical protein